MFNPGEKYRETEHGWEPVGAWEAAGLASRTDTPAFWDNIESEFVFWLVTETIRCGCPPGRAVKWWLYIISLGKKRHAEGKDPYPLLMGNFAGFLAACYPELLKDVHGVVGAG